MSTQTYRLLNLLLLAALVAGSIMVYPTLPARFPTHFGPSGQPDAWAGRSYGSWLALPMVAVGVALLLEVASRLSERHPKLWNVPDKPRFLALSPDERAPIIDRLENFMALVGVMTTLLLGVVQASIYDAARGGAQLPVYVIPVVFIHTAVLVGLALRMNARVGTLIRDAHRRRATA